MAKNVCVGDIVEFDGNEYKVTSVSSLPSSRFLIGASGMNNVLWLDNNTEDMNGWINERRVKLIKIGKIKNGKTN